MHVHDDLDPTARLRAAPTRPTGDAASVARAVADPGGSSPAALLELQRLAGNASVNRLMTQREDEGSAPGRSPVLDVVGQGGGAPLGQGLQSEMEGRLGGDFSDVRVHRDASASESAKAVSANAYTVGSDVVFRSDQWSPDTDQGKHTIAHELTHVMQQRAGPVAGTETGEGIRLSDPADPFERAAETNADAAMSSQTPGPAASQTAPASPSSAQREGEGEEEEEDVAQGSFVQREGEEEDELAQGSFVQREGEEEDELAQGSFVQREGEMPEEEEMPE